MKSNNIVLYWISSVNANVYLRTEFLNYETPHRGYLPLPKNEYPFYGACSEEEKEMFVKRVNDEKKNK